MRSINGVSRTRSNALTVNRDFLDRPSPIASGRAAILGSPGGSHNLVGSVTSTSFEGVFERPRSSEGHPSGQSGRPNIRLELRSVCPYAPSCEHEQERREQANALQWGLDPIFASRLAQRPPAGSLDKRCVG